MLDKPDALITLGLWINSDTVKGAQLSLNRGRPHLEQVFEIPMGPQQNEGEINPLILTEEGRVLSESARKSLVITCLSANETIIRPLEVKLKKDVDVDAVVGFQSEPLLPYPLDNAVVDWIKLHQTNESTLTTIAAARKDHLQKHIELLQSLELDAEVISSIPSALALFSKLFSEVQDYHYVIDIGAYQTTCTVVKDGKLIAVQSLSQGVFQLAQALAKDREIDVKAAKSALRGLNFGALDDSMPALQAALNALRLELMRTLFGLSKHAKGKEVVDILVTGEVGSLPGFIRLLTQQLGKQPITAELNPDFSVDTPELLFYAIPIGLALSGLPKYTSDQINFRQQEFSYPNPWKRYVKPVGTYLILCCALAFAIYIFGNSYIDDEADKLRQNYVTLLANMHKQPEAFEEEFAKKTGSKQFLDEGITPSVKQLSEDDIAARLRFLEKEVSATPDTYALLPNVPRVSDVLAWLQNHPNVVSKDEKTNTISPILQIDNFSYSYVKRPDISKKQEKYQVKIEMEFGTQTPKQAREFHDALLAPNDLVDPKGEVKWSTNRGKYRASFFLKDRTAYPSG